MQLIGKKIHFMGIGGIGMCALAEMANRAGAAVSGCDRAESDTTKRLVSRGIPVAIGHDPEHVRGVDLLVYTSAIPADHPERLAVGERQMKRGDLLACFMNEAEGWGVCGTHGKTTTSWLLASILLAAGLDPTVFVGGMVPSLPDGNYRLGTGPFVAELDESDASFLLPRLKVAVITNIESDHLSHYRTDDALFAAFGKYAAGVSDAGLLVVGTDSPVAAGVYERHPGRKLSFGFDKNAEIRAIVDKADSGIADFGVVYRDRDMGRFTLGIPGRHNMANALAAMGAALEMGVDPEAIREGLAKAGGVERRLERLGAFHNSVLYSDYAHHPTEVEASLDALRLRHRGKMLVVFQPHLYTRTRDYASAFGRALTRADGVLLVDIYPAREEPIAGVSSELLIPELRRAEVEVHGPLPLREIGRKVGELSGKYETIVMMGAGDIDGVARVLAAGNSAR